MTITLLSVVTSEDYIERTLKAMKISLDAKSFDDAIIICPKNEYKGPWYGILQINESIEWKDYSEWFLKNLVNYVNTDFVLCVQWDSCIINPELWDDKFLNYDYIGAPWPHNWINRVGNGGMSCRSKKFLEECSRLRYYKTLGENGEDYFACITSYHDMISSGIKFAPLDLARKFAVEYPIPEAPHSYNDLSSYNSFGFHGVFNTAGMRFINGS
jgi:hypothetical protein